MVDGVKDTDKSHERALRTLSGAMQTQAQTLVDRVSEGVNMKIDTILRSTIR